MKGGGQPDVRADLFQRAPRRDEGVRVLLGEPAGTPEPVPDLLCRSAPDRLPTPVPVVRTGVVAPLDLDDPGHAVPSSRSIRIPQDGQRQTGRGGGGSEKKN
ncbi:MAG: hypothetical protein WC277_07105, partial [Bacilli bacterium]